MVFVLYTFQLISSSLQEKKQKEALTRKQEKNRSRVQKNDEDEGPTELLQKPREYIVKFSFPDPPPLQPPILGLHSKLFSEDMSCVDGGSRFLRNVCNFLQDYTVSHLKEIAVFIFTTVRTSNLTSSPPPKWI
jgi:hypothetical protein